MTKPDEESSFDDLDIAIIGMAGRFPGASDCDEFWENLRESRESILRFTREELLKAGHAGALDNQAFVPARAPLADADTFDATFFGVSPREAEVLDPQQRVFLECAWHALEDAAYDPYRFEGSIGVFAGAGLNTYLLNYLQPARAELESMDDFQIMILNDKDTLATRVAYKLNLRGPAVNVQTSCSTGLVAVHLACNSLLNLECDVALAGAVALKFPEVQGYESHAGGILSPDGHCRAFDEGAAGTVGGSGVGVVVLKRLVEAIADGDVVRAVIRGSAINNDGSRKVSFTAPSVVAQAEVIAAAHARARVSAGTIGYVEAHGTATPVGDPIEVAALTRAFRATTEARSFCGLGSVKSNIGHLDTAAGMAGLLKTVLSLEHGEIPATLHFQRPNPKLALEESPFRVRSERGPWPDLGTPRRAGVSSFGVGGTNAHVVLEEAPRRAATSAPLRKTNLLVWSATSPTALERVVGRSVRHLVSNVDDEGLADATFTLQMGRAELPHRRALVCHDAADLRDAEGITSRFVVASRPPAERPILFLFPGQGTQHAGMARSLYESEPTFRAWIDRGASALEGRLGLDLRRLLLASHDDERATAALTQTHLTQPALFVHEHALAKLWMEWGVRPSAMVGHSIGEYVAACLADVMSFEEALGIVAERGALVQALPPGAMLAVSCAADALRELLPQGVSIAAVNAPARCVASGPSGAVDALQRVLDNRGIVSGRLRTSHAFHSSMLEPAAETFQRLLAKSTLSAPKLPIASNVTGRWLEPHEATDPRYWARHLLAPVQYADGVAQCSRTYPSAIWMEIGPGATLTSLARQQIASDSHVLIAPSSDPDSGDESERALLALARVWVDGGAVDWRGFHTHETRQRVRLPGYPFEKRRFFIEPAKEPTRLPKATAAAALIPKGDIETWFHVPSWRQAPRFDSRDTCRKRVLVLADDSNIGALIAAALRKRGAYVKVLTRGTEIGGELVRSLEEIPDTIVHAWPLDATSFESAQAHAFLPLLSLVGAIAHAGWTHDIDVFVVTEETQLVSAAERVSAEVAPTVALGKIIPQEHPNFRCVVTDVSRKSASEQVIAEQVASEIISGPLDAVVAFRGDLRFTLAYSPITAPEPSGPPVRVRADGTYVIFGGLGRVGLEAARVLARAGRVSLVLADLRDERAVPSAADALQKLRCSAARVEVCVVDLCDADAVDALVRSVVERHGRLDGVVHAAGCPEELTPIGETSSEVTARHFAAKVQGTYAIERALNGRSIDFVLLLSSLASILGGLGHAAYAASNGFLDAFAQARRHTPQGWISVNAETWLLDGDETHRTGTVDASRRELAMSREETSSMLARVLSLPANLHQVVVSSGNLDARLRRWVSCAREVVEEGRSHGHSRPDLGSVYAAPSNDTERIVAALWGEMLGLERVGVHDSFFELGGDSLLATRLVARIRERFRCDLPLRKLFETPTVEGVCNAIIGVRELSADEEQVEEILAEIEALGTDDSATEPTEGS